MNNLNSARMIKQVILLTEHLICIQMENDKILDNYNSWQKRNCYLLGLFVSCHR